MMGGRGHNLVSAEARAKRSIRREHCTAGSRRNRHLADALLTPWILVLLLGAGGGRPQPVVGDIFTEAAGVESDPRDHSRATDLVSSATHLRTRIVTIDLTELRDLRNAAGGRFNLNFFDDAIYAATVDNVAIHANGYSLRGRLDGYVNGRFNLVVHENVLVGTVRDAGNAAYHVRFLGDGKHVVRQIAPSTLGACGVTPESTRRLQDAWLSRAKGANSANASGSAPGVTLGGGHSSDDGTVLDILVLYSDVTREAAGGTSAIRAEIQLAVDVANSAYLDSGVGTQLRLVHMDEVVYDEVTGWDGFEDHLVRLWDPADGYYDEVHELRDRYGADLVSLIVEDSSSGTIGSSTCGIAPVMQEMSAEFESLAISAVNRQCSADNWTLVHEIGHNQGCAHNRENAGVDGLFTHSYGHWFKGNTRGWRTIMAYASGDLWERVGHFSNPAVSYDGTATGVSIGATGEAHNTSTINATRVLVAGFRITRYWVDFDWSGTQDGLFDTPFGDFQEGLDAVPDGGMIVVKSGGVVSGARIFTKRLKINSWNGSTVIGVASP